MNISRALAHSEVFARRYGSVVAAYTRAVVQGVSGRREVAPAPCCVGFGFGGVPSQVTSNSEKNSEENVIRGWPTYYQSL